MQISGEMTVIFHAHLCQSPAPALGLSHMINSGKSSAKIVSVREPSMLCNKTQNLPKQNSLLTKTLVEFGTDVTIGLQVRAFNCLRCAVRSALVNGFNQPKSRARHLAPRPESDANILAWIKKQTEKSIEIIHTNIKNYCPGVLQLKTSRGRVGPFILQHSAELAEKFPIGRAALASFTSLSG
jgi:hypothetical protein